MRRYWREQQPSRMFRGAELMRLMTGIVMLGVLYMLYTWAREPNTWRWLAPKPPVVSQEPPQILPPATGPTDEDPEQADEARNEFQAITDGTLNLGPEEMEAYGRLVEWVKSQSFDRLSQRAKNDVWYTNLYDAPDRHRGQLVALDLDVRRAQDLEVRRNGVDLHEAWGPTDESRGRLYDVIVVDYPPAMPVGYDIREEAKFVGYFLKLQGYESARAKPGQAPEKAPLLIGRLQWEPAAPPPPDNTQQWIWKAALVAGIGLVLGLWLAYNRLRRRPPPKRRIPPDAASGEVIPIDAWLERANFDANDEE